MAFLRQIETNSTIALEPEHVVGRALTCSLRLDYRYVSAQHAMIRHDGAGWVIRDLASRNGTWLDGHRLLPGDERPLRKGARLAFGIQDAQWEMAEDSSPTVMAIPLDGSPPVILDGELIALPSADDPRATIYRGQGDGWVLEEGDAPLIALDHLRVFHCAGRAFRFSCPNNVRATVRSDLAPIELHVRDLALAFTVSLDEEHVDLRAHCGERVLDLGERTHHYLLLTLARVRLAETRDGIPDSAAGWLDVEYLCRDSKVTRGQIGVDVFRIRKQLTENAVVDAARLIERRPGQLRIGTAHVTVERR